MVTTALVSTRQAAPAVLLRDEQSRRNRDHLFDRIAQITSKAQIDQTIRDASNAYLSGGLSEPDYGAIAAALTSLRSLFDRPVGQRVPDFAERWKGMGLSRFKPHIRKTMPTELKAEYMRRRRRLAAGYFMPDELKEVFTTGQLAALAIVSQEFRKFGTCSLCIEKIAGLAGVCHATVRRALALAAERHLILITYRKRRGDTNLPNVLTLISRSWKAWLDRKKSVSRGLKDLIEKFSQKIQADLVQAERNQKCNPTPGTSIISGNRPEADYSAYYDFVAATLERIPKRLS